ncbi:MAG: hypothetical protein H7Z72_03125 [Bacteroidetes bacterium]|nr:hypothetical protein [Fibrella sp.]
MFKASRELLRATIVENDVTADVTSKALDEEMTRMVEQLAFVQGADTKAVSAVVLGAMSYLTILAQNDRTMIGLDLRSEEGWQRIEEAVKLIYKALNKMAVDSPTTRIGAQIQSNALPAGSWSN